MRVTERMPRSRAATALTGAWLLMAVVSAVAQGQRLVYSGSVLGTTGDYYFDEQTASVTFTNALAVELGRVRMSASVPLVYQTTPWITTTGMGRLATGGPAADSVGRMLHRGRRGERISMPEAGTFDRVGMGDPMIFGSVDLWRDGPGRSAFTLTGALKFPVASTSAGFGTGAWDYSGGVAVSRSFGRTTLFADASYWVLGDIPGLPLRDVVSYGAAVGRLLGTGRWMLLGTFSGSGATIAGGEAPAEVGMMVSRQLASGRSMSVGLTAGLTDASPDLALSAGWRVPIGRRDEAAPPVAAGAARSEVP